MSKTVEKHFETLLLDFQIGFNEVQMFYHVATNGLPDTLARIVDEMTRMSNVPEAVSSRIASQRVFIAKSSIAAASLVFSHALLDSYLFSLLQLTLTVDPEVWSQTIKKTTVSIEEIEENGYDEVCAELKQKAVNRTDGKSLPNKVKMLMSICKPEKSWRLRPIDEKELLKFDESRHIAAHGKKMQIPFTPMGIESLKQVGIRVAFMFQKRYFPKYSDNEFIDRKVLDMVRMKS